MKLGIGNNEAAGKDGAEDRGQTRRRRLILIGATLVVLASAFVLLLPPPAACAHGGGCSRAAQSGVRNATAAAKVCFTDADTYVGCGPATLAQIEPSLTYVDGTESSDAPAVVSVSIVETKDPPSSLIGLAVYSEAGACFYLQDDPMIGTSYGQMDDSDGTDCFGRDAIGVSDESW